MVLFTGISAEESLLQELQQRYTALEMAPESFVANPPADDASLFLIGPGYSQPIKAVQTIFAADKLVSIIVLAEIENFESTKKALLYSAFVGKNTTCICMQSNGDLAIALDLAITRTKQRRSFQKLAVRTPIDLAQKSKMQPSFLGNLLEQAPIGVLLLNTAMDVINFNQKAREWLGFRLHHQVVRLSHLFAVETVAAIEKVLLHEHSTAKNIVTAVEQRFLEITSTTVLNEDGNHHFFLLLNDITEQKQEEQRIRTILEALPLMAWTTNDQGSVTYFSLNWFHYTGQTETEAMGEGWLGVVHPDDKTALMHKWAQSLTTGQPMQQAVRFRRVDGTFRWHLSKASPIRNLDKKIAFWVGTSTDIHDQVLLTEELERKVKERTRQLEESNSELEQFAYVSSHDLQEPLRKIRIFSERVQMQNGPLLDESGMLYLQKINDTAARMSQSLKDLLHFTKLSQEEKFGEVNLNNIIRQVLFDLELNIQQKDAKITWDELPSIQAAAVQMKMLFYNLINNAIKFSKPDLPPKVHISSSILADGAISSFPELVPYQSYYQITVKDNGIGFEQKYAQQIFNLFQRLHDKTTYPGSGIGLGLAKKVVANHKGAICAKSEAGKGTTFHIILPG